MPYVSICIPTYEMNGRGAKFLQQSFSILVSQTFKDFNVVISDHSLSDLVKDVCDSFSQKLDIHYVKNINNRGSSSANINNAIQHASGKLIKILFQDDFLFNEHSLKIVVDNFDVTKDHWLVTGCEHSRDGQTMYRPFVPKYNDKIHLGNNTISSPSVLTIKNEHPLMFDVELIWLMDCDYYKRCFDAYGLPKIVPSIAVVNRTGDHQVSNTMATKELQQREYQYVVHKFNVKFSRWEKVQQTFQRILHP